MKNFKFWFFLIKETEERLFATVNSIRKSLQK